ATAPPARPFGPGVSYTSDFHRPKWPVGDTPPPQLSSGTGMLQTTPAALRLFVERARAAEPSFALTPRNAPAAAAICRRLDGIPLALELAAARVRAVPVEQMAARLDDRFRLLTTGSRTALPRHQTLQATMDWSWDLLTEPEQVLARRLSVFAGGWTLEAAEAVCADEWESGRMGEWESSSGAPIRPFSHSPIPSGDVLDLLTSLVEKSL